MPDKSSVDLFGLSSGCLSEKVCMARVQAGTRLVVRFERGLCPRNPVRGEVRKGGGAPLRVC